MRTLSFAVLLGLGIGIAFVSSTICGQTSSRSQDLTPKFEPEEVQIVPPGTVVSKPITNTSLNPFGGSQDLKETAEQRIIDEIGVALEEISLVQSGVEDLKIGQQTTHDLLRGMALAGIELNGSMAARKAELEQEVPGIVQEEIAAEWPKKGLRDPSAPPEPVAPSQPMLATDVKSAGSSTKSTSTRNADSRFGSVSAPVNYAAGTIVPGAIINGEMVISVQNPELGTVPGTSAPGASLPNYSAVPQGFSTAGTCNSITGTCPVPGTAASGCTSCQAARFGQVVPGSGSFGGSGTSSFSPGFSTGSGTR